MDQDIAEKINDKQIDIEQFSRTECKKHLIDTIRRREKKIMIQLKRNKKDLALLLELI